MSEDNLYTTIEELKNDKVVLKSKPRFIIVTDFKKLLAYDTKTTESLDIEFQNIYKHIDFFIAITGKMEKTQFQDENPADVRASIKLAKLYDEISKTNKIENKEDEHALNVFLTRLLFCYFAEDTHIFKDNQFTNAIKSHTSEDGNDLDTYLQRLFEVFNTKDRDSSLPEYLQKFPYVNGGLFRDTLTIPKFTFKSRKILIEIGTLQWKDINPDIFGSMIQAVVSPEHRGNMGMHYTSVPNILKVIQPLFLDELEEQFLKAKGNTNKLNKLHQRISTIKVFDPACGSGNFLIITYKKLRELEMKIFREGGLLISPSIKLTQFYGIELDDFAHEVAQLSLWLAEHQMNMEFKKEFGVVPPPLPLSDNGNIVQGNATRVEWEEVCPKEDGDEIYILGNPPFEGARIKSDSGKKDTKKEDMKIVFDGIKGFNNLDYVACWFYKGAKNIEINFAYQSFKWKNNAKDNAKVTVIIVGLRNESNKPKYLYISNLKQEVKNINAYLVNNDNIIVYKRTKPLSNLPEMSFGSMPNDDSNLLLTVDEKNEILEKYPDAKILIKRFTGSQIFIKGILKYCLWITDDLKELAYSIPPIQERIEKCKLYRENSTREATRKLAKYPYKFGEVRFQDADSIIVPATSSERREYIPCGFLASDTIISNSANAIFNVEVWMLGIVMSKMHMAWVRVVGGRLKNDLRYSATLVYNTFPFPDLNETQKDELTDRVLDVIDYINESGKTYEDLYKPNKMDSELKKYHQELDRAIEKCYRDKPFENDEERLEYLFKIYEEMVANEKK